MYNKYKSRRYLITLWAIGISSFIMLYSIYSKYDSSWLGVTLPLLIAIPSAYILGDSYSKKFIKEENEKC